MKKLFLSIIMLYGIAYGQSKLYLRGDTVQIYKEPWATASGELRLVNSTRDTLGPLVNIGAGKTRFYSWRQVRDSASGGGADGNYNLNLGLGYRLALPYTVNIKTLFGSAYVTLDSSTNTNGITFKVDTSNLHTGIYNDYRFWLRNIGSGYRWAHSGVTNDVKTAFGSTYITIDSSSNSNALTFKFDTTNIHTTPYNDGLYWRLTGNNATTAGTNFVGTTDSMALVLKTYGSEGYRMTANGASWWSGNTTTGITPTSGLGTRMMWIPAKKAFRAGNIGFGTAWDDANIGDYSWAGGTNTMASGLMSFAFGAGSTASGQQSIAFNVATASGLSSFAVGTSGTLASGINSVALMNGKSVGSFAFTMGNNTYMNAASGTVFGINNDTTGYYTNDPNQFSDTSNLFVIGNGGLAGGGGARHNALSMKFNGITKVWNTWSYAANYGSTFTSRTLVDKGYVDSAIIAGGGGGSGLTVGSTSIASGTNTRILYDNSGTLGEYTISGSGNVAMTTSPTFTTPALGTPSAAVLTNATGLPLTTGVTGNLPVTNLNSGTSASSSTFWRGDGTWATPAGSGTVNSGTQYQLAYYATSTNAVSGLTLISANNALVSNSNGLPVASSTTSTQLAYLSSATGTTGTTSTNLVFSGTPTIATPSFTTGFTIGGAATSRKIIVGNGTNFVASTETWAVPGTSGNVLTSDGTNWTSAAPAGAGTTTNALTVNNGGSGDASGFTFNGSAAKTISYNSIGAANTALSNLASVAINATLIPGTSDAVALGSTTKQWSDLFIAEGAVINWDNGDATLTQQADTLTLAGADLRITRSSPILTFQTTDDNSKFVLKQVGGTEFNMTSYNTAGNGGTTINLNVDGELELMSWDRVGSGVASKIGLYIDNTEVGKILSTGLQIRYVPRVTSAASYTTSTTIDATANDLYIVTAQAGALLFNNPSGTSVSGQGLRIWIKDNGTARALTWGSEFRGSTDLALPSTTTISKGMKLYFERNLADSKWDLVGQTNGF